MHYSHLTIKERESIYLLRSLGYSIRNIASKISRSPSSVLREIKRNVSSSNNYSPSDAHDKYLKRRYNSIRNTVLSNVDLKSKVESLLQCDWSPEQVSNRLKRENNTFKISYATIYRGMENGVLNVELKKHFRRKYLRYRHNRPGSRSGHLTIDKTIHDRPNEANERGTLGHFESDTVWGAKGSWFVATHVDRKSRYLIAIKIPTRKTEDFTEATIRELSKLPEGKLKSLTVDHGKEFARHREISKNLNIPVYFADPNNPGQRGTNENTNGLLRQYLPKRRILEFTQEQLDEYALRINCRPKKCLGWLSPFEVFFGTVLHFT